LLRSALRMHTLQSANVKVMIRPSIFRLCSYIPSLRIQADSGVSLADYYRFKVNIKTIFMVKIQQQCEIRVALATYLILTKHLYRTRFCLSSLEHT
jgi:hypothetical protein